MCTVQRCVIRLDGTCTMSLLYTAWTVKSVSTCTVVTHAVTHQLSFQTTVDCFLFSSYWRNKHQLDQCKMPSDGISSGTFATILGGITIWNPWSNKSYANLEDSACPVRVLLFFSIGISLVTDFLLLLKISLIWNTEWHNCMNLMSITYNIIWYSLYYVFHMSNS